MEERIPISIEEAIEKVIQEARVGETETVPLLEAEGRFLAEDLIADHPIPFFDRSGYDGYALRAVDTEQASSKNPIRLQVIDTIGAGEVSGKQVGEKETIRIMTGAQMPAGADAVVMLEDVQVLELEGKTYIQLDRPLSEGENMHLRGEDTAEGTVLAQAGRQIRAGEMAMLATFGYAQVKVYKQPMVGIFTTGTELLPVDAPLEPGKIRNSNAYMLVSQVKRAGGIPRYLGILPDDLELCFQSVKEALQEVDFLITTGGAAVGDFDFVQPIIQRLGAKLLFNKLAMRPGSVTTIAKLDEKWLFGLSGNPAACFVGLELFVRPVLRTYLGEKNPHLQRSKARLEEDITKTNNFTRLMRAKLELREDRVIARPIGLDKSNIVSSLIEANGLLIVPPKTKLAKGDLVDVIWFDR